MIIPWSKLNFQDYFFLFIYLLFCHIEVYKRQEQILYNKSNLLQGNSKDIQTGIS